jgi:hypothetical protein
MMTRTGRLRRSVTVQGVARLDRMLMSAVLLSEGLGARYSWRLGRRLRAALAATHQGVLRVAQRRGWTAVDPSLVEASRARSPRAIPRFPFSALVPESAEGTQGVRHPSDGTTAPGESPKICLDSVSWLRDPFGPEPSTPRFLLHCLHGVAELMDRYEATGRMEDLDRALRVTSRWIQECLYAETDRRVWDDHVAAVRTLVLARLWALCQLRGAAPSAFTGQLLGALARHAQKLAHRRVHRPRHNHGVTQAYALLAAGLVLPDHPDAAPWVSVASRRLEAHMAEDVSPEGVHREHSPHYQVFVGKQFHEALRLAQAYGLAFSRAFVERLHAMLGLRAYLLKPDGTLPAFGDTYRAAPAPIDKDELRDWPVDVASRYLYSRTQGAEGLPPEQASILLPGGGYAILRSGWGVHEAFRDERHLTVRLSTFPTTHIHRDAFSFELYGYGADLIVDSGGPFSYGRLRKEYFQTTAAHNTVAVDGGDQAVGPATVLRWAPSSGWDFLMAEHGNYRGVTHRRAVLFVRPRYVLVLDLVESATPHRYRQIFHLSPCLEARLCGLCVATHSLSGGPTVQLVPLLPAALGLELRRGSTSPYQGWVCVGERRMVPGGVVEYRRSGSTESFATLIVAEPPGAETSVAVDVEGEPLRTEACLRVGLDGCHDEIRLSPSGEVRIARSRGATS